MTVFLIKSHSARKIRGYNPLGLKVVVFLKTANWLMPSGLVFTAVITMVGNQVHVGSNLAREQKFFMHTKVLFGTVRLFLSF